jgi:hypothetical protein
MLSDMETTLSLTDGYQASSIAELLHVQAFAVLVGITIFSRPVDQ